MREIIPGVHPKHILVGASGLWRLDSEVWFLGFRISSLGYGAWNLESGLWGAESGVWSLEYGVLEPGNAILRRVFISFLVRSVILRRVFNGLS